MIVRSTGRVISASSIGRALAEVELADEASDKRVMGVFAGARVEHEVKGFDPAKPALFYNALGEGQILVTDIAGAIGNGDLVVSSRIPGYGQLQPDDVFRASTVAKCTQAVDWNAVTDTIDFGGRTFKRALVACTYHCG